MTGRGLQPKYSHRKNARHHLMKMAGMAADADRARQATSQLVGAGRSIDQIGNLTENTFMSNGGDNYQGLIVAGSIHGGESSIHDLPAGHNMHNKKNSVDHVHLRGMLPD